MPAGHHYRRGAEHGGCAHGKHRDDRDLNGTRPVSAHESITHCDPDGCAERRGQDATRPTIRRVAKDQQRSDRGEDRGWVSYEVAGNKPPTACSQRRLDERNRVGTKPLTSSPRPTHRFERARRALYSAPAGRSRPRSSRLHCRDSSGLNSGTRVCGFMRDKASRASLLASWLSGSKDVLPARNTGDQTDEIRRQADARAFVAAGRNWAAPERLR